MNQKKEIKLFFITIFLILIFTPVFGGLYKIFFGPACTGFLCSSHPEYLDGFFISYMFFIPLLLTLFAE